MACTQTIFKYSGMFALGHEGCGLHLGTSAFGLGTVMYGLGLEPVGLVNIPANIAN